MSFELILTRGMLLGLATMLIAGMGEAQEPSPSAEDSLELGKRLALKNRSSPDYQKYWLAAVREADVLLEPVLQECALEDCLGAGMSNRYVVRLRADGTFAEVLVEPANRFTQCVASKLQARGRLRTAPPSDDYWLDWSASGIMRLPDGCEEELRPSAWHSVKWWLFMAETAVPQLAILVKILFIAVAIAPFVLGLVAWKLLRPDGALGNTLRHTLIITGFLLAAVALSSFLIGYVAKEESFDTRENTVATILVLFPLVSVLPLAWSALRPPTRPQGSRGRPMRPSLIRRAGGIAVLVAVLVPTIALGWFGIHENVRRVCPSCLDPIKLSWLG